MRGYEAERQESARYFSGELKTRRHELQQSRGDRKDALR
jgi:hypothetical protein